MQMNLFKRRGEDIYIILKFSQRAGNKTLTTKI